MPLILVVIALAAAAVKLVPPPPTPGPAQTGAAAAFPPPPSPVLVSIDLAGGGPAYVGFSTQITVAALGLAGIAVLELWVGGTRVELTETADPSSPTATQRWDWTPTETGDAVLVARAYDGSGRSAQSAPLRVTAVAEPPRSFRLLEVTAEGGETLDALVARVGGDLDLARHMNDQIPAGPLPAGLVVQVPRFDPIQAAPVAVRPRALADAILVADLSAIMPTGLAVPTLDIAIKDCTVTATASNGGNAAAGFAFMALPPVGDAYVPLPPVAPKGDGSATTSFNALGGMNFLTVSSYTGDATAPSAIVPIAVPPGCGSAGWTGDARLDAGKLIVNSQADKTYLYLKVGDDAWQRVPGPAGSFVSPTNGVFDFGALLPELASKNLRLEAWGWTGGVLNKLGSGQYTAPSQVFYSGGLAYGAGAVLGFGTSLDVVVIQGGGEIAELLTKHSAVDRPGPNSGPGTRSFKWSTTVPGITHLVWQVLPYPLDTTNTTLTPPFLIDSGTIDVKGNTTGYFPLDLNKYLLSGSSTGGVWSANTLGQLLLASVKNVNLFAPSGPSAPSNVTLVPNSVWWPKPTSGTGSVGGPPVLSQGALDNLALLAPPVTSLYVRVIPFVGQTPIPNASNVVSFDVVEPGEPFYIDTSPPPSPPSYDGAFTIQAKFFAPTGSNSKYARCVRVVKGGKNLSPTPENLGYAIYGGYDWTNGTVHCQPPPSDDDGWSLFDAFESFVGWVGEVWDYVSAAASWIEDQVVNVVLALVPCEQIANQVSDSGKDVCKKIAKTALQAAMVAYGIPPEIPNWESTISAAKGDLREFILSNAELLPGVSQACAAAATTHAASTDFPTCDALVDSAIDSAVGQLVKQRSEAAASSAGVMVPPGVTVEPDPRSMAQPPHFEVKLTRTSMPLPAGVVCTMSGSMTSLFKNWSWLEYQWAGGDPTTVQKTGDVTGQPFMSVKQVIAPILPGGSVSYDLWLTKGSTWFEPDGWNDHYAEQYANWHSSFNHAWVLLQAGATITSSLTSNCFPAAGGQQILTGQAWQ